MTIPPLAELATESDVEQKLLWPILTAQYPMGLGLASPTRNAAVPDVPTYGEMGFPNVYSGSWVGFFAPAKTPDAIVQKLNTEIYALMKEPDSLDKIAKSGFDPVVKNVAETSDYFKSEVTSWGKMVNAIGFSN